MSGNSRVVATIYDVQEMTMYKKLDENDLRHVMETGIKEFADKGFDRANINDIAKAAGVSVGVIYKYYDNKDSFFLQCVRYSLETLDKVLQEAFDENNTARETVYSIIRALQRCGREHGDYYVMYNEITSGSCKKYAAVLADEIESRTAVMYRELFERAGRGECSTAPQLAAFLFDNLLMMLQFSYSCDYYRQRMKIFCGENCFDDDVKLAEDITDYICRGLLSDNR